MLFSLVIITGITILIVLKIKKKEKAPIKILLSDFNYEDSKSILNLEIIDNNDILINKTLNNIDNSLIICQNHNIS